MNKEQKTPQSEVKISLSKRKEIKDRKRRLMYLLIAVSAMSIVLVVLVSVLFLKIEKIEVKGNTLYSAETVIEASGITANKSILALNRGETEAIIKEKLPGVKEVKIIKKLPSKVIIDVTEANEVFVVAVGRQYFSLDDSLKVISVYDTIEKAEVRGLKRIFLPDVTKCIVGEILETEGEDIPEMVLELYRALVKYEFLYDITEIDFRDKFNITVNLGVRYRIRLGNILESDTKLEIIKKMIEELDENESGVIEFMGGDVREPVLSRTP